MVDRVIATPAALDLIAEMQNQHGPVLFHLSAGCCDGSSANCFKQTEFFTGPADIQLGTVGGAPFFMGKAFFEYWRHSQVILDVTSGMGAGTFSLEGGTGKVFLTRSRILSDEECAELEAQEAAVA